MQPFAYARPATLADAFALLDEHGPDACLLAGGTDVVVGLRNRTLRPEMVIDLKQVAELQPAISEEGSWLTITATTALAGIDEDQRIHARFPALIEAAATVGSAQIRNRATLTGNSCHASPAADTAPALLAYGARVNVASARRIRRGGLYEFFVGPGKNLLQRGGLVTAIDLPVAAGRRGGPVARITPRRGGGPATITICRVV